MYDGGKIITGLIIFIALTTFPFYCNIGKTVARPEPEAIRNVDIMPWYHIPVKKWRSSHMNIINSGAVTKENCLPCHYEPEKFCNKCHEYVGVKGIFPSGKNARQLLSLEIVEGLEPTPDHIPIGDWRTKHDEAIIFRKVSIDTCYLCHSEPDKFCNRCHKNAGVRNIITLQFRDVPEL